MKILHVDTGKEWRGGQRQALFLHDALRERGHDSRIVCNEKGVFKDRLTENYYSVRYRNELDFSFVRLILEIVDDFKPDIIHSHDAHALTPSLFVRMLRSKVRHVHTRRVDFSVNKGWLSVRKYRNRWLDRLVAISGAVKNILKNDGIPESKIDVIYDGVYFPNSVDQEAVGRIRAEFNGKTIVGNLGNFADHKDHYTLIKAYDKICHKRNDTVLLLVGDGPLYQEIQGYVNSLSCKGSVIFTGFRTDVYELISAMDIFVITSKEEGLCTTIIDAMHLKKPIVATRAGGIPELVKDGCNGYLSEVREFELIAQQIIELIDHQGKRFEFGKNGKNIALGFNVGRMTNAYVELYHQLKNCDVSQMKEN